MARTVVCPGDGRSDPTRSGLRPSAPTIIRPIVGSIPRLSCPIHPPPHHRLPPTAPLPRPSPASPRNRSLAGHPVCPPSTAPWVPPTGVPSILCPILGAFPRPLVRRRSRCPCSPQTSSRVDTPVCQLPSFLGRFCVNRGRNDTKRDHFRPSRAARRRLTSPGLPSPTIDTPACSIRHATYRFCVVPGEKRHDGVSTCMSRPGCIHR